MTTQQNSHRVWFITGTSQGFGRELVRAALQRGDSVVATSRNPQSVSAAISSASRTLRRDDSGQAGTGGKYNSNPADRLLAVGMDLRDTAQISSVVHQAITRFGRIDVLVNNAGYGVTGAVEEASEAEIANVYDTNVFGLLRVTRAVLPQMRKQRSGHIVNLSSIGGLTGMPGWGIYNSTKFAVEGLSEALAAELTPLGIGVTVVEPGPFRTDFLGGSLVKTANTLPDYAGTAGKTRSSAMERNGKQQGDPAAAADAIVEAVTSPKPPLHLILGKFAYDRFNQKLDDFRREMDDWRELGLGTDFKS